MYSRIHIGNARPFVVFSLLKRFLEHEGYAATLVVNVTDVNDKIYDAASAQGRASAELAAEMTELYRADTDALGLGRPDHEPLASETIGPIVDYIQTLIDRGHAYPVDGDVYFRVRSDERYGSLSHRQLENMDQGEGVEGAERKEDPLDFALWKAHKPGEDTVWESPWGAGRPGWHIECSAMAEQFLGVGFDIHGGGSDLVFPHHENEAAQTRAARGQELTRLWMHNGMIQFTGEKMAKSVGNIALLHEVLDQYRPAAVVMYLVSGHYRQPLAFSPSELEDADRRVYRIRDALRRLHEGEPSPPDMAHHKEAFFDALANDFNTPNALASLFEWVREANRRGGGVGDADLREMLAVIGLRDLTGAGGGRRHRRDRSRGRTAVGAAGAGPQGARLRDGRPHARGAARPRVGDPRRTRRSRADSLAGAVIVYGRNPVREALRGRRAGSVSEVWATAGASREPWLASVAVRTVAAEEVERRCGSSAHQGLCAEAGPYRYASAEELLVRRESPAGGARPGPGPAEPRLDLPHRGVRGRGRRGHPRAPGGRGDAGCVQGLGRSRRAPARGAGAQPRRLPRRRAQGGVLVLRRKRRGPADLRSVGRAGAGCIRHARLPRVGGGAGAGKRGQRPATTGGQGVRSADRAAVAWAGSSRWASARPRQRFCTRSCRVAARGLDKVS